MRKDEHIKIVSKLEAEIEILQKRMGELSKINSELEFDAKLHRFVADQRADAINKMMSNSISNLKNLSKYDTQFRDFYKQSIERIDADNAKFDELKDFIKKNYPDAIVELPAPQPEKQKIDEKLSQTLVGENGEIYKPYHVIDVAILIMNLQKSKLKEILGDDDDFNPNKDDENNL